MKNQNEENIQLLLEACTTILRLMPEVGAELSRLSGVGAAHEKKLSDFEKKVHKHFHKQLRIKDEQK